MGSLKAIGVDVDCCAFAILLFGGICIQCKRNTASFYKVFLYSAGSFCSRASNYLSALQCVWWFPVKAFIYLHHIWLMTFIVAGRAFSLSNLARSAFNENRSERMFSKFWLSFAFILVKRGKIRHRIGGAGKLRPWYPSLALRHLFPTPKRQDYGTVLLAVENT